MKDLKNPLTGQASAPDAEAWPRVLMTPALLEEEFR
jgi:hypothetical protein